PEQPWPAQPPRPEGPAGYRSPPAGKNAPPPTPVEPIDRSVHEYRSSRRLASAEQLFSPPAVQRGEEIFAPVAGGTNSRPVPVRTVSAPTVRLTEERATRLPPLGIAFADVSQSPPESPAARR